MGAWRSLWPRKVSRHLAATCPGGNHSKYNSRWTPALHTRHSRWRRNILNFWDTQRVLHELVLSSLFILVLTIVLMNSGLDGPDQYAAFFAANLAVDLHLTLAAPALWLWRSFRANWEGWSARGERRAPYFHMVGGYTLEGLPFTPSKEEVEGARFAYIRTELRGVAAPVARGRARVYYVQPASHN